MSKSNKVYFPLVISVILALGVLIGDKLNLSGFIALDKQSSKMKLNRLIDYIDQEYVDDVNTDSIVDITVNGIMEGLDPHSVYISKNEIQAVTENMKGDFVGIGINFYMYKDTVAVIKPTKDGPSEKAGIQPGDRLLYADNYQLFGKKLGNDSLFSKLKGVEGSEVMLTVYRKTINKKIKFKLKRDVIPIKSVDAALKINDELGYIKINRFAETTYDEFKSALNLLTSKGMKSLIIDLRDNGGGYLEIANMIIDELLKKGELIVKTKNKKGKIDETYATDKGIFEKGSLYVLVNENSASASEILAGAIQDNDRGVIIGRRTFGKGLVQREMPLGDGSAVRLTVARYYTPSGRSIQKPFEDKGEAYFNEFEKRFQSGELFEADTIKIADSLKFKTKKGRTVYGGGGISPDLFVPFQAKHGEEATIMVMQSGVVSYFVFEQLDKNRTYFEKMSNEELFDEVTKDDKYLDAFKLYVANSGVLLNYSDREKIVKYLYAEFVKQIFDDKSYFEILLSEDSMVKKVLELEHQK